MSFKYCFRALDHSGGFCLGFGFLIMIWMLSLVFDATMIQILALYLDFEGAKKIPILQVLIWDFKGGWRFMSGVWHLDNDLNMATGL